MQETGNKPITWCHIHIPKTGGTSLRKMFADNFGDGYFSAFSLLEHKKLRLAETQSIVSSHWNWLRCYSDHRLSLELPFDTDLVDLKALAFIREPVDQIVSQYHFQQSKSNREMVLKDASLNDFVESRYRTKNGWSHHLQIRRLAGITQNKSIADISELIARRKLLLFPLDQFDLACVVLERLHPNEFRDLRYTQKNRGPERSEETPAETECLIRELAAPDFRLYALAQKTLAAAAAEVFENNLAQTQAATDFHNRSISKEASVL